jgi:hypothetical protein
MALDDIAVGMLKQIGAAIGKPGIAVKSSEGSQVIVLFCNSQSRPYLSFLSRRSGSETSTKIKVTLDGKIIDLQIAKSVLGQSENYANKCPFASEYANMLIRNAYELLKNCSNANHASEPYE